MNITESNTPTVFFNIDPEIHKTEGGTPFFKESGVALIAQTVSNLEPVRTFLESFEGLDFAQYLDDPTPLYYGDRLTKFAGQICYMSMGEKRTTNADADKYFENIKKQNHGSIMEHSGYTFLIYGVDRTFTHELVRHRIASYSQISQRYVDDSVVRYVGRDLIAEFPEFQKAWEDTLDNNIEQYENMARFLMEKLKDRPKYANLSKRDLRKKVNQTARINLFNCTEAPIVVTMNARAWRHFIEMRGSRFADAPIRDVAHKCYRILHSVAPQMFSDYEEKEMEYGGIELTTPYRKV